MQKYFFLGIAALIWLISASILTASHPQCNATFAQVQRSLCGQIKEQSRITWRTWLQGKSRSTQFHFLDLVELLFGDRLKESTPKTTSNEPNTYFFR